MLNSISQTFHRWTTGWRVLILFIAEAFMAGYIMPLAAGILAFEANNSVLPLDLMVFYTPGDAFAMIEKYGEAGRELYMRIELTADLLYMVIYTLFFSLFLSWLFQRGFRPDSNMQKLNVMPLGTLLFDFLENFGIVSMLSLYPSIPDVLAWITMIFGTLKFGFFIIVIGLVLVGLVKGAMNRFRKQLE